MNKSELSKIRERFSQFLSGQMQIASDEAFQNAVQSYHEAFLKNERVTKAVQAGGFSAHDFREVFRTNIEKRIRSLPEIDGLSKETVLNSWMTKFDTIFRGDEDAKKPRFRGAQPGNADMIMTNEQLYDLFQQILGIKRMEHQLLFNAAQVKYNSIINV